jgi:hypothetical protein
MLRLVALLDVERLTCPLTMSSCFNELGFLCGFDRKNLFG